MFLIRCPLHGLSPQSLPTSGYGKHKEYAVVQPHHPAQGSPTEPRGSGAGTYVGNREG